MPAEPAPITAELLRSWRLPPPGGDKESRGRVLVIGGTAHTPGAVLLAGEAVLRAGAGKLQIATAEPVAAALAVAVPEALVVPVPTTPDGDLAASAADQLLELAEDADAVVIGSGFSRPEPTLDLLGKVVPELRGPLLLDAVASAYLGHDGARVDHLEGRCVLCANPGEVAMTLHVDDDEVEEDIVAAASALAARSGVVVLCGGTTKTVATPDGQLWSSGTGGPGLGVSGSGDVQAGLVGGLLGRGADTAQAAVWGAHLHGSAGDVLASRVGTLGFLARDIATCVPALLEELTGGPAEGSQAKERPVRRS
jgi:ADP-dependent NAD(P)H-hydrate dehydratase